jgi:hypothetical protein
LIPEDFGRSTVQEKRRHVSAVQGGGTPAFWAAAVFRRFFTCDDHAKAPEHWRSPKPRGKDLIRVQTEGVSRIASQRDFHERRVDILSLPDG